jgi:hypothetical protein
MHREDNMKFNDVVALVLESGNETPFCLLGPPGTGKTSLGRQLAQRMTELARMKNPNAAEAVCIVLDLSSRLPEDIGGLPNIQEGVTRYAPQSWLAALCEPGSYGILVLDDLPAATPAVQVAVRQLVLDRQVGEAKLSDGIKIIVTGNRREDKSAASVLPAHFRNSVCLLTVDVELESWCEWYGAQDGLAPVIPSFLRYKNHLSKLPKDAQEIGSFATPRSWAKLGRLFDSASRTGTLLDVASGLIGEGVAIEFNAFVNTRSQLIPPDRILKDPVGEIPNPRTYLDTPDKAYAAMTGIAEVAAAWLTKGGKEGKAAPGLLLVAMAHLATGNKEYAPVCINTFAANSKNARKAIDAIVEVYKKDFLSPTSDKHDPKVVSLMNYCIEVMSTKK